MSRIYLADVDLSTLDLKGVSFADSILAWSNFSFAKLDGCSFANADLQGVSFVGASATRAKFTVMVDRTVPTRHDVYVREQMNRETRTWRAVSGSFVVDGPNFTCADLSYADFTGHPVVPIYPNDPSPQILPLVSCHA
jgi:uncharacterized protein YjbI with pentapeptide repeats